MGDISTSGEFDQIDGERRRTLALLGLWGAAACTALALAQPRRVLAASGDDDDDSGGDSDDPGDSGHGDGDEKGSGLPPEAPTQERRRGSRKAQRERRWRWLTARRERCQDSEQLLLRIRTCSQGR